MHRALQLGALALVMAWPLSLRAEEVATTFFAAPDLSVVQTDTPVLWQQESTDCAGNDGGDPSQFILDPGCAVRSSDEGAIFLTEPDNSNLPGMPPGTDFSNGLPAALDSDGTTATLRIDGAIWGPIVKNNTDRPGLLTIDSTSFTDFVFTIDVATGEMDSYSWTGDFNSTLGPGTLNVALAGEQANWYTAEATQSGSLAADGAINWICGGGGLIAQPLNNPNMDPGSLGTCPPNLDNLSPTVLNAPYDAMTGTIYANASSATLAITPRAWAPVDGRISTVPEPGAALGGVASLLGLLWLSRRRNGR